jgi:hypothetical protein
LQKYLRILRRFLRRFPRRFPRRFLRRFLRSCIAVCAVASPSHRRRIAVASQPHRSRITSAPHRVAARNAGGVRTSLESNLPAVQPNRRTWTEEVEQRALGEAMIRTHVEVMVERM